MRGFPVFPDLAAPRARYGSALAVRAGPSCRRPGWRRCWSARSRLYQTGPDAGDTARHCGRGCRRRAGTSAGPPAAFSRCEPRALVIAQRWAGRWRNCFRAFGAPVAAASIAQVHSATTSEGAAAAVKVLRPGIERIRPRSGRTGFVCPHGGMHFGGSASPAPDRSSANPGRLGGAGTGSAHGGRRRLRTL